MRWKVSVVFGTGRRDTRVCQNGMIFGIFKAGVET